MHNVHNFLQSSIPSLENTSVDPDQLAAGQQGFSNLSEVWARGLLNLGKKAFGLSELGKFDAV